MQPQARPTVPAAPAAPPNTPQPQAQPQPIAMPVAAPVSTSAAVAAAPGAQQIAQQMAQPVPQPQAAPATATPVAVTAPGQPTGAIAAPSLPAKNQTTNTAQKSLLISEIRDGLVVMKDGSFRAVIAAQSINFDLMSPSEQDGVEYAYQSFLNSLNFDIQIAIRSQKIDIGPYLDKLATIRRNQDNMLLNVLMDDYMIFIDALAREANIMDKSFFLAISYGANDAAKQLAQNAKKGLNALVNPAPQAIKIGRPQFEAAKTELARRSAAVIDGLRAVGVPAVRLDTRALAMLYYNFNNPDTAVNQPLVDWQRYTHLYTTKGTRPEAGEEQNG